MKYDNEYFEDIPPNFETVTDARSRRQQRINVLRRGDEQHTRLAQRMERCTKKQRCRSEADPICAGKFRLWLYRAAMPVLNDRLWTRASVITSDLLIQYGQLAEFDLNALVKRYRKRFERSSLRSRIVIGGIDISLNLDDNEILGWQLHLYLLVEGRNCAQLREAVRAIFPPEPIAPHPYRFRDVTDPEKAITYLYKSIFYRRSRYVVNGEAHTRQFPLKGDDVLKLLAFLDKYPVGVRLVLNGLRRNGKYLTLTSPKRKPT